jgi:hypothetical protein
MTHLWEMAVSQTCLELRLSVFLIQHLECEASKFKASSLSNMAAGIPATLITKWDFSEFPFKDFCSCITLFPTKEMTKCTFR